MALVVETKLEVVHSRSLSLSLSLSRKEKSKREGTKGTEGLFAEFSISRYARSICMQIGELGCKFGTAGIFASSESRRYLLQRRPDSLATRQRCLCVRSTAIRHGKIYSMQMLADVPWDVRADSASIIRRLSRRLFQKIGKWLSSRRRKKE